MNAPLTVQQIEAVANKTLTRAYRERFFDEAGRLDRNLGKALREMPIIWLAGRLLVTKDEQKRLRAEATRLRLQRRCNLLQLLAKLTLEQNQESKP